MIEPTVIDLLNRPILALVLSLVVFWFSGLLGAWFRERHMDLDQGTRTDLTFVLGGALTLLGLIIGFTFSMAVSRYDQRKNTEAVEANAIETEYVRADFLPAADAAKIRALLKNYLEQRIIRYKIGGRQILETDDRIAQLQTDMWSALATSVASSPMAAYLGSGMNDVANSQRLSQAAWRNRIPIAAWTLMIAISIFCKLLIGLVAHGRRSFRFAVLPVALSICLFLIADIDSPLGGIITVRPENLESLVGSMHSQ